mmetsp:Transcript_121/g.288  ORF Transcript_121/g.288 Transcript_121/m.288 type:complete len:207 (-) Transcript_121:130-750(-)
MRLFQPSCRSSGSSESISSLAGLPTESFLFPTLPPPTALTFNPVQNKPHAANSLLLTVVCVFAGITKRTSGFPVSQPVTPSGCLIHQPPNFQIQPCDGVHRYSNLQLLRCRGGGRATLRRRKRDARRQIWERSNHKTRIRTNLPGHLMLANKKRQGFIGVKKIQRDLKKKFKSKAVLKQKKRWEKLQAMEKFQMLAGQANLNKTFY